MNQLEYLPGIAGQSVQLDGPSAFVGIAEEMRSREWDYDLGYRDLVTATRPARTVDVTFHADYETADTLRRVADADVMARTPGTFVAQKEWKQRGYILASNVDDIHYGRLSTGLKIALLDGAWWRLAKRSFVPEITTPEYRSATGETVTASGASGAPLHALTVDGKAVQDGTPTPSSPVPVEVLRGINLLNVNSPDITSGKFIMSNGTLTNSASWNVSEYIPVTNSDYVLHGAGTGSAVCYALYDGSYGLLSAVSYANRTTVPISATGASYLRVCWNNDNADTAQLERGTAPTTYIPYGSIGLNIDGTITPIDLQGYSLSSLRNGAKNVLAVDSVGHKMLNKRVGVVTYDGSESWTASGSGSACYYFYRNLADAKASQGADTLVCSHSLGSAEITPTMNRVTIGATKNVIFAYGNTLGITTAADFKTWLSSNPVTLYYELDTPQTIDLGYIDMPAIPLDAQISVTAAVTPTITAEWQISRDAYLDYPHNYPYDYQKTSSTADVTPSVLTPSDVYLAVFGPAVNPYVIVGGNRYQVNVTVPSGGYLVVDGRDKTIQLTLADGTVQNVFSSGVRGGGAGGGSYIFEKVPAGTSEVTYDGSFGFDLGWYEEEGEPPWSQS